MNVFLTSDLHLNHDKDFVYAARGFSSIEEHDEAIIENWNSIVHEEDIVYVLGDLSMGTNLEDIISKISRLNGRIHIIIGNHDTNNKCDAYLKCENVESCLHSNIIKVGKWSILISHRPTIMIGDILANTKISHNICAHGHTHSNDSFEYINYGCYNVALDAHNNRPVNVEDMKEEIIQKIQEMKNNK